MSKLNEGSKRLTFIVDQRQYEQISRAKQYHNLTYSEVFRQSIIVWLKETTNGINQLDPISLIDRVNK